MQRECVVLIPGALGNDDGFFIADLVRQVPAQTLERDWLRFDRDHEARAYGERRPRVGPDVGANIEDYVPRFHHCLEPVFVALVLFDQRWNRPKRSCGTK